MVASKAGAAAADTFGFLVSFLGVVLVLILPWLVPLQLLRFISNQIPAIIIIVVVVVGDCGGIGFFFKKKEEI